jgi:hypothetical protein
MAPGAYTKGGTWKMLHFIKLREPYSQHLFFLRNLKMGPLS